jgi:hypothetical protein
MQRVSSARGRREPRSPSHEVELDRWRGTPSLVPSQTSSSVLQLQRTIGNIAARGLLGIVQRQIAVKGEDYPTLSPGSLASKYLDTYKSAEYSRVRSARGHIEKTGEAFESRADVFARIGEVMDAQKGRSIQPIWREPIAGRVAIELDYYFDKIDPKPKITFVETYETSWDKTGGWGAEYAPPAEGTTPLWVIHLHRGPSGGLKAARVKLYEDRKLKEKGSVLMKHDNLAALGIAPVDTKKTH